MTEETLKNLYIDKNLTLSEIGKIFGVPYYIISNKLKLFNIKKHKTRSSRIDNIINNHSKEYIQDLYINRNFSTRELGKHFGIAQVEARIILKRLNIYIKPSTTPKFSLRGRALSEEHKRKISLAQIGIPKINPKTGHGYNFKGVILNCDFCHKEYSIPRSRLKYNSKNRFCSHDCHSKFMTGKNRFGLPKLTKEEKLKNYLTTSKCGHCNNIHSISIYEKKRRKITFCSQKCYIDYRKTISNNKPNNATCYTCGKNFYKTKYSMKIAKKHFCSRKCVWEKQYELTGGPNNGCWTGGGDIYYGPEWPSTARKVRKRDNNTCQKCGRTKTENNNKNMDVHHCLPIKFCRKDDKTICTQTANNQKNLISYCGRCHKKTEMEFLRFFKSLPKEHKNYISSVQFYDNFYHSPNSISQEIQELILKSAPTNIQKTFVNALPVLKLETPFKI